VIGRQALNDLRAIVAGLFPTIPFLGLYRYRVVSMAGDRVKLQAVRATAGLPDILPVSIHPGMAGLSAQLTKGSVVLVTFIEGDPSSPIVTHFAPKGDPGFLPVSAALDAKDLVEVGATATEIRLGAGNGRMVCEGDSITVGSTTGVVVINTGHGLPLAKSRVFG
jgi:hypothetical protein